MGILFPDPPTPPNPILTGALQTATNIGTGITGSYLNNYNQVTPQGNLTYSADSTYAYTDPASGQVYQVPRWTATQSLPSWATTPDAEGWSIDTLNKASQYNLGQASKHSSYALKELLGQNQNILGGAPQFGDPNSLDIGDARRTFDSVGNLQRNIADTGSQQGSFGDVGSQQYTFDDAGNITRDYGPADNFSADRARVEESLYGRLNPQLERDRSNLEQRLADQGIRYGSDAYNRAMDDYNRQSTDARLAVTAKGGEEQQRMNDMAAQRAGFQNAAQQQAYQQAMGRGTFANTAQQTAYEQALGRGKFANEAQAQEFVQAQQEGTFANQAQKDAFSQEALSSEFENAGLAQDMAMRQQRINAANTRRSQFLGEQYGDRNQRLNEITALQSGSQITPANFVNTPTNNIPTTDYAGLINNRFSQDMGIYNQQNQNINQIIGGIFGATGSIGKGMSDRREKENIDRIGTIFAAGPDGEKPLPIYEYEFKKEHDPTGTRHIGPMAQDVEKIDRRAVTTHRGIKYIDKTRMGSILKAA
jgi:hypothetical protein